MEKCYVASPVSDPLALKGHQFRPDSLSEQLKPLKVQSVPLKITRMPFYIIEEAVVHDLPEDMQRWYAIKVFEKDKKVMEQLGMNVDTSPIRGGTDGSQLSYRGLPCPNLGTGGYCFHGPLEHISAENMDMVVRILLGIIRCYAQK